MIFVTGDTHGDFTRFSSGNFLHKIEQHTTVDDIVIVCGDFGGVFRDKNDKEEQYWLKWLSLKSFTLCFVDGNHENFDRYYSDEFEIVDFHGGKAHRIRDNIYHLMRGYVFNFEGKKFFCMGGASSHDISDGILDESNYATREEFTKAYHQMLKQGKQMFRVNHRSWWKEELPSQEEMDFGEKNLEAAGYKVDYVISHCLPGQAAAIVGYHETDSLNQYFNKLIDNGLQFGHWYCGHYHNNIDIPGNFHILYERIIRIE